MELSPDPPTLRALLALRPVTMTRNAWLVAAGVNRNFFGDLRRSGNARIDLVHKLLDAADVSRERWGEVLAAIEAGVAVPSDGAARTGSVDPTPLPRASGPRDVPILGTAEGSEREITGSGVFEPMTIDASEVVDYLRRPPGLTNKRDVYALYVVGTSMSPRFEPGDPVYVDPKRAASIQDDVIVQLAGVDGAEGDEPRVTAALIKRLVKRSAGWIELQQFNPPHVFRLELRHVARMHRVVPNRELYV